MNFFTFLTKLLRTFYAW